MVGNAGETLNLIFDDLADWNTYLKKECSSVYPDIMEEPEP